MKTARLPYTGATSRDREIARLFREYNGSLVRFVCTRLGNRHEAAEVAQEAYLRLLQLEQTVAEDSLRWYLFKIASHIATDRFRQLTTRGRIDHLDEGDELDLASPTECSVMAADELAKLVTALRELPPKLRKAFLLCRLGGLSSAQIAARINISDRMVRLYIKRALAYCRMRCDGMAKEEAARHSQW